MVHPLLKKPGLDLLLKNFRPISNLQFVSKLTECVVANQIWSHMIKNNLFPQLQSAYCSHHSTETALLKVKNDLLMNMNKGHVSLLVLLDLSAAFDTVEHKILLKTLQMKLGVCGSALSWFKSYLEGRSQRICIKETLSQSFDLQWGVPQGSCLGPLLFTINFIQVICFLSWSPIYQLRMLTRTTLSCICPLVLVLARVSWMLSLPLKIVFERSDSGCV